MGELKAYPAFCGPTYNGRSLAVASDRCINFYPELNEIGTSKNQSQYHLMYTPGIKTMWQTGKDEPIRGICTIGFQRILFAGWSTLYEVNPTTGALITLGEIAPDEDWEGLGCVTFAWNGNQYAIASGGHGYILDGNTLTETIPMDMVTHLDGYFVAMQQSERKIRLSGLYDGLSWDELDYAEKESQRDYPVAIVADHGELWILGAQTSEVWYNSGNSDFSFERVPSGRLELGCVSPWSAAKVDNSLFWLGNDERGNRVVWRADGYQARRISTHSIEYHMNLMIPRPGVGPQADTVTGAATTFAIAWTYQEEGHSFYCLLLPTTPKTWSETNIEFTNPTMFVYDCATQLWHERAWWNKQKGCYEPPRARCHSYIWDHHFVGDRANGTVYEQSLSYLDDAGERIRRERTGVHLFQGGRQVFYNSFELHMEVAVGLGAVDSRLYGSDMYGRDYYST